MSIELNSDQVHALYSIENWWNNLNHQIFGLSGSPGTGKTSLVNYFIDKIGLEINEAAYLCYSGKGAVQLARKGLPAQTIHSLIYEYKKVLDKDENGKIQFTSKDKPKMKYVFKKKDTLPNNLKLLIVDEASMVNRQMAEDLLSYGLPVIALGDLNQLPPVMGNPYFLVKPNYVLTKIMRQEENNPIVYISQKILNNEKLEYGVYGKSSIQSKSNLNDYVLLNSDIILTNTNKLKNKVNKTIRENLLNLKRLDMPNIGEKLICVKNNWHRAINNSIYLINGMTGYVDYVDISTFNGKGLDIDFRPDFLKKKYKNVTLDYNHLFSENPEKEVFDKYNQKDQFEFGYCITTHKSQGSEWDNVCYLDERGGWDNIMYKKLIYTAVTRAIKSIQIFK